MANESTTNKLQRNWYYIVLGALVLFVLINYTLPWIYKAGCCTYNGNRSCGSNCSGGSSGGSSGDGDCPDWNGECTREITDECCGDSFDVRMCGGQRVSDPRECYSYYCRSDGYYCGATYGLTGEYVCSCMPVSEGPR